MDMDRRTVLLSLSSAIPIATLSPQTLFAQDTADTAGFLAISRIITGSDDLSAGVAARIAGLLRARITGFDAALADLSDAFASGGDRAALIEGLSDAQTDFAIQIARPWYLGFTGSPSGRILEDDAEFATFLEAQAYVKVSDVVPLVSYPPAKAGWWNEAPAGVDASDLPDAAKGWDYQPETSYDIAPPDPVWRAYAAGDFETLEAARSALADETSAEAE